MPRCSLRTRLRLDHCPCCGTSPGGGSAPGEGYLCARYVPPEVLTHMFTMHMAALASATQAVAALRTVGAATIAPETPEAKQRLDASMALLVDHGVDPAPLLSRDTPQDTQGLPDPLHDFAASLTRTDGCPVCFEVARATRG